MTIVCVLLILETMSEKGEIWHVGPFLGGVLIAAGWVFTNEISIRNSRTQHTINMITQQAFDKNRLDNRAIIKKDLPIHTTKLTETATVKFADETSPLLQAIDLELNFFEFIAAGVFNRSLDERLLLETLKSRFCTFYEQNADYIAYWRGIGSGTTWRNIARLYERWSKHPGFTEPIIDPSLVVAFYVYAFATWAAFVAIFDAN